FRLFLSTLHFLPAVLLLTLVYYPLFCLLIYLPFFFYCSVDHRHLHSFPTRRSSDLIGSVRPSAISLLHSRPWRITNAVPHAIVADRKSTRLNSSHGSISYAVFCLKKKKTKKNNKNTNKK